MGHTLLCVLELFLLNTLLYIHAEANTPKAELSADDRDIPVGGNVTLTCSVKPSSSGWIYAYVRGEKPTSSNFSISAGQFSVSQEGVYWCRGQREKTDSYKEYTEYSDSITIYKNAGSRPESSSIPVGLIVGLVWGIVLLLLLPLLLFLLYRYRSSKNLCFIRQSQSESTNQGSDTNHVINQNEAQVAGGSQDVTYSSIELKNTRKKGKQHEPEESSVYSDVKTRTADDNLTYAQVNPKNKGKAKKTKGKPRPAATDETVYSDVKPGRSLV